MDKTLICKSLVSGEASGQVLYANVGVSFMGGVDPTHGIVKDTHHPLHGKSVAGKILAIPSGRGSCAGSLLIFELLMNGHAPKALVFQHKETILTLGVIIATELYGIGIPVVCLAEDDFLAMAAAEFAHIDGDKITLGQEPFPEVETRATLPPIDLSSFEITDLDHRFLKGEYGEAAQVALRIIIRTAQLEGVNGLVDVDMAHIDGNYYQGPAGLQYARKLCDLGARVRVPSSMNALCVDRRQWREQGVAEALGVPSEAIAEAYVEMGVQPTYTCAPYLLDDAPVFGQQIAWGESNAVVFANSVLGARTLKYPDYLDILVAITGRAPNASCHRTDRRLATLRIDIPRPVHTDDAYFAALGYLIGKIATNEIPVICGLEGLTATRDDLKSFGAAFATTSAAAMFHIVGVTPEAATVPEATGSTGPTRQVSVTSQDLTETWHELNTATTSVVDLISLGNPHFSLTECELLARLCKGRTKSEAVDLIVTCGRQVFEKAKAAGYVDTIVNFGGRFLNDTCWCLISEPVIKQQVRNIATNSGKYAHYGPAAVPKGFHFASLERCVEAACTGVVDITLPAWLSATTVGRPV